MSNPAYEMVKTARKLSRPTSQQYIDYMIDGFVEFHGDRQVKDDKAVVGGIGFLSGKPVTIIGIQKGQTLDDNIYRNFGQVNPDGYRKALRLMKQAEKFGRPVITLVNTAGAYCGIDAEERGQGEAIARNLMEMSGLRTPIISIIIGEGASGGALGLAVADRVWVLENSFYSILSPEGFSSILWKDGTRGAEAAEAMRLTPKDLLEFKVVEEIIPEAPGGADQDFKYTADIIKEKLINEFEKLFQKPVDQLLNERYMRFRKFGEFTE